MNIEVEIRSFLTKEEYDRLLIFFKNNSNLIEEDLQETHYFDCAEDVRIQKNNNYSKIWMKKGQIHDDAREEIEVRLRKEEFPKLEKIFDSLGHNIDIKWFRKRFVFDWEGIYVMLDHTKGYGYIIELEKISTEEEKEGTLKLLRAKLDKLGIKETPKEVFKEKYEFYKDNWKTLTMD